MPGYTGAARVGSATTLSPGEVLIAETPPVGDPNVHIDLGAVALTYAASVNVDPTTGSLFTMTLTGALTLTAANAGAPGQKITLLLTSDGTGRTTTFSTGFKPQATLAGTASKTCSITFISDSISWWEESRSGAAGGTGGM